ncbi:hypothetical protein KSP39_PZI013969 [Platanthera zijinensis]|uniref:Uncharacterized protein n=1 Tax=Platanthera zijinensis TaxID=2320716 RepID=A0AAP0G319_9ASPA
MFVRIVRSSMAFCPFARPTTAPRLAPMSSSTTVTMISPLVDLKACIMTKNVRPLGFATSTTSFVPYSSSLRSTG